MSKGQLFGTTTRGETRSKSGRSSDESIVYVVVDPKKAPPKGFEPSHFHSRKSADGVVERFNHEVGVYSWDALANMVNEDVEIYAPHSYRSFQDVMDYPFTISAFEVDGRYLGLSLIHI